MLIQQAFGKNSTIFVFLKRTCAMIDITHGRYSKQSNIFIPETPGPSLQPDQR